MADYKVTYRDPVTCLMQTRRQYAVNAMAAVEETRIKTGTRSIERVESIPPRKIGDKF